MTRRFFSGSTLDQAVMMAARHYEIDPAELAYRQIEKRHGFLRTRKAVMIAVDPEQPRREAEPAVADLVPAPVEAEPFAPMEAETAAVGPEPEPLAPPVVNVESVPEPEPMEEPEPMPQLEPASEEWDPPASEPGVPEEPDETPVLVDGPAPAPHGHDHDDELLGAAEEASQNLMRFAGIEGEASARSSGERVEVEVEGPDTTVLVVEGGKGLLAIQHLLPRMLRGLTGRSSFVRVDSRGFHQQRRERLETLALKEAEAASRSGTPRTLPPMAPDERRIVHLALEDDPTVVTESRGTGLHKRIVVRPVSGDGGSDDIEARHGF